MGKKQLVDPTVRKRKRTAVENDETKGEEMDLWGMCDEGKKLGRPNNKLHGVKKTAMVEASSKALKLRETPGHAQSYNPPQEQHLKAISEAVHKLKRKEAIQKKIADKVKINPAVKKGCVGDDLTESAWAEDIAGEPRDEITTLPQRKTRTQRNKARRLTVAINNKRREKIRSKVVADADRIDEIQKELSDEKVESAKNQKKRKLIHKNRLLNPRIGRRRFRPSVMDLQTTEDVSGSLRQQGKVVSSMRDPLKLRFESFQSRNIIPATAPLQRRVPRRPAKYFVVTEH
eukprot:TRINITY_DN552_c1_g2_i1.p1 TRINITY_DN552_c1_g2~~TRINITY_DN552_c1_g2_i1.p1  ORF type:complete len:288 (+),score=60.75 TRINITY_DN552_c1_g2_i1:52-915(+)